MIFLLFRISLVIFRQFLLLEVYKFTNVLTYGPQKFSKIIMMPAIFFEFIPAEVFILQSLHFALPFLK